MSYSRKTIGITAIVLSYAAVTQAHEPYGIRIYRHASTAGQGYLDGYANYVGAWAHGALMYSEARIAHEEARRVYLENRFRNAQNHYSIRRLRDDYYAHSRRRRGLRPQPIPVSADDKSERAKAKREKDSMDETAPCVEPGEPQYQASRIPWPELLLATPFDYERLELERVAARTGTLEGDFDRLRDLSISMRKTLRRMDGVSSSDRAEVDHMLVRMQRTPRRMLEKWAE